MKGFARQARTLAFLGAFCIAAMGAGRAQAAPAPTQLTVSMAHTIDATPFYYALRAGLFEKAGLAITLDVVSSGSLATVAVVGGAAQIGFANTLSQLAAHEHNIPLVLIAGAGLYDAAAPLARLFVASDSPISTARDLEGRVVAVSGLHDLLALSVKAWLTQEGADPEKVRFVELGQTAMLPALEEKRVDCIGLFEPFASGAADSGKVRTLAAPYTAIAKQFLVTAWFVNGPWLAGHRDVALRFARVIRDATAYSNAHVTEMIPIVASFTGMTDDVVQQALRTQKRAQTLDPGLLQPVIDAAAKVHELDAPFPAREVLVTGG
jgi:NitT/TauT family transport system substrate-binding protein